MDSLFDFFISNMICLECKHYFVTCEMDDSAKNGFAYDIKIKCTNCRDWSTKLCTSKSDNSGHKEINVRMVSFVRSIGRGHSALENFSMYVNMPQPMTYPSYKNIFNKVHAVSKEVATESMVASADGSLRVCAKRTTVNQY